MRANSAALASSASRRRRRPGRVTPVSVLGNTVGAACSLLFWWCYFWYDRAHDQSIGGIIEQRRERHLHAGKRMQSFFLDQWVGAASRGLSVCGVGDGASAGTRSKNI